MYVTPLSAKHPSFPCAGLVVAVVVTELVCVVVCDVVSDVVAVVVTVESSHDPNSPVW